MSVELLQTLSLVSYIIAGVMLLVGIALFFLFDVPKLYGDVSGRTAKKAIAAIRQQNESTGNKAYRPSAVNAKRGKLTDKITQSGKLESQTAGLPISVGTEKFVTATLVTQLNETTVLEQTANETSVLTENSSSVGDFVQKIHSEVPAVTDGGFTVDVEMSFTGSSEIIE